MPVGNVLDDFTECFEEIVNHVNAKRIQAQAFQDDVNDPNARVLQIDFSMAYQCKYQNEVQSALWTKGSVNLFTCALYHYSTTKAFVISRNYKGKDKFATGKFLDHLHENEIPEDDSIEKEIIWSNGPSSEFKNKFMWHLMETLSKKYATPVMWKFSATSHGKGAVDGVGGKGKIMVRRKLMSMGKDSLVVQNCKSFVQAAKKLLKSTSIIHIDRAAIEIYKESQPFNNNVLAVKGIFKMHVIEVFGSETKLCRNCTFQKMTLSDIHLKPKKASPEIESEIVRSVEIEEGQMNKPEEEFIPIPDEKVKEVMSVIVTYEEEKWIGKVVTKCHDQVCVRCLEKSFGIHSLLVLQNGRTAVNRAPRIGI